MNTIVTIGREYGSGGREIGRLVADRLGVPFYDKEILTRAAADSGICEEVLSSHDEKARMGGLFAGMSGAGGVAAITGAPIPLQMPLNQRVFLAQFDAITKLASENSCVIVGRCADYVLKQLRGVTHVFLYASAEKRIERIMRVEDIDHDAAKELVRKVDKQRRNYYNFFADGNWGLRSNYDLMIRTDDRDPAEVADMIVRFVRSRG